MRGRETLRPTAPGDEGRLKTLWKVCFGDEDTYIGHFFAKGYVPGQGLVLETGGEIASMLLPFSQEIVGPDGTGSSGVVRLRLLHSPGLPEPGIRSAPAGLDRGTGNPAGQTGRGHGPRRGVPLFVLQNAGLPDLFFHLGTGDFPENQTALPQVARVRWRSTASYGPGGFRAAGGCVTRAGAGPGRRRSAGTAAAGCTGSGTVLPPWSAGGRDRRQGAALPLSGTVCPGPPGCSGRRAGPGARTGPGAERNPLGWSNGWTLPPEPGGRAAMAAPGLCLRLTYRLMSTSPATHSSIPMT